MNRKEREITAYATFQLKPSSQVPEEKESNQKIQTKSILTH